MDRIEVKVEGKRSEKNKNDEVKMYGLREGEWEKALQKGARQGWEMELEKESRIKNGRELKEAMQTRAKKKRREQEKWEEGIRGIKGKNKMDSLREKTLLFNPQEGGGGEEFWLCHDK